MRIRVKDEMVFDFWTKMKCHNVKNITELAFKTGIPTNSLKGIANNSVTHISDKHLDKLCEFFSCRSHELVTNKTKEEVRQKQIWMAESEWHQQDGIVYFAKSLSGKYKGQTKIGFTKDLNQRLKCIETEYKTKVELVLYLPTNDATFTERLLHRVFKDKRVKGEWFDLNEDDYSLVKEEKKNKKSVAATTDPK